ncbi:ATP-binding protein [Bradyrhizobium sp. DOA9]|uniref:ATP-binding protein n=1 Tax=Bradyrhizobium sp. DOA9 TaxID=1126627 RepID=UPI00046AD651|nr:ATP-binding protein [Bradyrhizobium sp. DOA9]
MIGMFFGSLAGRLAFFVVASLLMAQVGALAVFRADRLFDRAVQHPRVFVQPADGTLLSRIATLGLPKAPCLNMLRSYTLPGVLYVVLVLLLEARWITRPLRALVDAVDSFGRGEAVELSRLSGPSEIVRAVNAFNLMQQRLSRLLEDRLSMVATITHDLRTQITVARLRAEMIEDAEAREVIVRSLTDLQHIVDATLSFARDEIVPDESRIIDLVSLIESVANDLAAVGWDVGVAADGHLHYRCRPALLRRALTNLMSNAVKYGNCARVALELADEHVCITIDDEGPGLPSDQLQRVFEPFVRLDSSRYNENGGIGLGLSIARSAIRAHGGEVTLTNMSCGLRAQVNLPHGNGNGSNWRRR